MKASEKSPEQVLFHFPPFTPQVPYSPSANFKSPYYGMVVKAALISTLHQNTTNNNNTTTNNNPPGLARLLRTMRRLLRSSSALPCVDPYGRVGRVSQRLPL
jgi:hypothetical protein